MNSQLVEEIEEFTKKIYHGAPEDAQRSIDQLIDEYKSWSTINLMLEHDIAPEFYSLGLVREKLHAIAGKVNTTNQLRIRAIDVDLQNRFIGMDADSDFEICLSKFIGKRDDIQSSHWWWWLDKLRDLTKDERETI